MSQEKDKNYILKEIRALKWEKWLQRPFGPFVVSLFADGASKEYFNKIGLNGGQYYAMFFYNGVWYINQKINDDFADSLKPYLKRHNIFDLVKNLNHFLKKNRKEIKKLIKEKKKIEEKLKAIYEILTTATTYVWSAHGLERLYYWRLHQEIPKYIKGDIEKFIGDAGFPKKKNAYAKMVYLIIRGVNPETIVKKYGWLKVRDGYSMPYTVKDIIDIKKHWQPEKKYRRPFTPKPLRRLFREMQELVYYRTARMDAFFELLFLARPIFIEAIKKYQIAFKDLENYTIQSLIVGKPKKYSQDFSFAYYQGRSVFVNGLIVKTVTKKKVKSVKGIIAQPGLVRGKVKVVNFVSEISKVKPGDILVAPMTFPNFITGMQKAAAFVTNEGGITCHAAIVAREMKKPCLIGTKIATEIFKDGDLVEVDAYRGIVQKLKG